MRPTPSMAALLRPTQRIRRVLCLSCLATSLGACMMGPTYERPTTVLPDQYKEGTNWTPATANPDGALKSTWWTIFGDATLNDLIERSATANQSIVAAEAAYRVALAEVLAARAGLFPTLSANLSATRSRSSNSSSGGSAAASSTATGASGSSSSRSGSSISNSFDAGLQAAWEPDLWGSVRRTIEANADLAQASDAQLAGERLSIAAALATDYFLLRQADIDLDEMQKAADIDAHILSMIEDAARHGTASNDQVLQSRDVLDGATADLENAAAIRETYEHAIAVLVGVAPAQFSIAPIKDYTFVRPTVPIVLPSVLLERRPDIVIAERTAAGANARIGVAQAAYFPTLDLSASASVLASTLPRLISAPTRVWSLGPALAETIFDGGARDAQIKIARATYDEDVGQYRETVLTAFQNVEDSLSQVNHLRAQAVALNSIYRRDQQLYQSILAQKAAGTASPEDVLNVELTLNTAHQNWSDTEGQLAQNTVTLIKNLGGGWDGDAGQIKGASAISAPSGTGTTGSNQPPGGSTAH